MEGILSNALQQGLSYGFAVLGVMLAFRILRFPDLTADGSFLIGGSVFAWAYSAGFAWPIAAAISVAAGGATGGLTAFLAIFANINRLLAGILTTMLAYSLGFRVLGGRSVRIIEGEPPIPHGPVELLMLATAAGIVVYRLLQSDYGIALRATGQQPELLRDLGRRPERYTATGLIAANGLVALSACLVTATGGFASAGMGTGIIILLVASLVLGEGLLRALPWLQRLPLVILAAAPFLGCCLYYFLYLAMLRASIRGWLPFEITPPDMKALSAILLILVHLLRFRRTGPEGSEIIPI